MPTHDPIGNNVGGPDRPAGPGATAELAVPLQRERDTLYTLLQHAPIFMALVEGADHRFTFANAAYYQLVGCADVIGLTVSEVLPSLGQRDIVDILARVRDSGKPFVAHAIARGLDTAGRQIHVEVVYQPMIDPDGVVTGVMIRGQNISERHASHQRTVSLQNDLIKASRTNAMVTMASTLAHELNQPLAVIHSYMSAASAIASVQQEDPVLLQCFEKSRDAALRAGEIIRRLRDLTISGYVKEETLDLRAAVKDAIDLMLVSGTNIHPKCEFGPGTALVSGDRIQVQQILFNLLRNACESAGDNPCAMTIVTRDTGAQVEICVRDSGPGIPTELLPTLFEPFKTTKPGGMGVGLSICKTIVEAHGGTIYASNHPGGGAAVCFTLDHAGRDGPA